MNAKIPTAARQDMRCQEHVCRQIRWALQRDLEPLVRLEVKILRHCDRMVLHPDGEIERFYTPEQQLELCRIGELKAIILANYAVNPDAKS